MSQRTVCGVQQAQGGLDAGAGEDEAAHAADPADVEAVLCGFPARIESSSKFLSESYST